MTGIARTGAEAMGCTLYTGPVSSVRDCAHYTLVRPLQFVVGIIVMIYRAIAECCFNLFGCCKKDRSADNNTPPDSPRRRTPVITPTPSTPPRTTPVINTRTTPTVNSPSDPFSPPPQTTPTLPSRTPFRSPPLNTPSITPTITRPVSVVSPTIPSIGPLSPQPMQPSRRPVSAPTRVVGSADEMRAELNRTMRGKPIKPIASLDQILTIYEPGANFDRIAININWSNDNERLNGIKLFDKDYMNTICGMDDHPDWSICQYGATVRGFFQAHFVNNGNPKHLSAPNLARLKLMMLVIMNVLNALRDVDVNRHKEITGIVFWRISDAIEHCVNNVNPTFENIMSEVLFNSSTGPIEYRVLKLMQSFRLECLEKAAIAVVTKNTTTYNNNPPDYYKGHQAASVTWYVKQLYNTVKLPQPASALDSSYESMALKERDDSVLDEFRRRYTLKALIPLIYTAIGDTTNPAIPTQMFTDWCRREENPHVNHDLIVIDPTTGTRIQAGTKARPDRTIIPDPNTCTVVMDPVTNEPMQMLDENEFMHIQLVLSFLEENRIIAKKANVKK